MANKILDGWKREAVARAERAEQEAAERAAGMQPGALARIAVLMAPAKWDAEG